MRKIKRILIFAIVTIIGVASFGCKPSNESVYPVYGDFECKVVTEHNGVKLDTPYVSILELSEEGKSKKTIVVPSKISGYEVRIGVSVFGGIRDIGKVIILKKYIFVMM